MNGLISKQTVIKGRLVNFHIAKAAENKSIPLLFLHGWRSESKVWNQVMTNLARRGFNCYALDLPGFGSSETPKQPYRVEDYGLIVKEWIQQQKMGKIILIGHSFGGRISIKLASKHPELIEKLILVDSGGIKNESSEKRIIGFLAKLTRPLSSLKIAKKLRPSIYKLIGAEDYLATPELQKTFLLIINEDLQSDMQKITVPTLIIWGKDDIATPLRDGKLMNELISNSKLSVIPQAGHYCFLDNEEYFNSELTKFL